MTRTMCVCVCVYRFVSAPYVCMCFTQTMHDFSTRKQLFPVIYSKVADDDDDGAGLWLDK